MPHLQLGFDFAELYRSGVFEAATRRPLLLAFKRRSTADNGVHGFARTESGGGGHSIRCKDQEASWRGVGGTSAKATTVRGSRTPNSKCKQTALLNNNNSFASYFLPCIPEARTAPNGVQNPHNAQKHESGERRSGLSFAVSRFILRRTMSPAPHPIRPTDRRH